MRGARGISPARAPPPHLSPPHAGPPSPSPVEVAHLRVAAFPTHPPTPPAPHLPAGERSPRPPRFPWSFCKLHVKMADLTSVLTSAMFSPSSKMFIGGLSWQTSPGKGGRGGRPGPPLLGFLIALCYPAVGATPPLPAIDSPLLRYKVIIIIIILHSDSFPSPLRDLCCLLEFLPPPECAKIIFLNAKEKKNNKAE